MCIRDRGDMIDLGKFAELGKKGVLALLADSTNAERSGYTMSERTVGGSFDTLFKRAEKERIIIATFASNIHRVQQIIDCAYKYGRKVALSGRSMVNVVGVAMELGYLNVPDGLLIDLNMLNRYPKDQVVLITTGSQGEPCLLYTSFHRNGRQKQLFRWNARRRQQIGNLRLSFSNGAGFVQHDGLDRVGSFQRFR